jgi:hypothetical protein
MHLHQLPAVRVAQTGASTTTPSTAGATAAWRDRDERPLSRADVEGGREVPARQAPSAPAKAPATL